MNARIKKLWIKALHSGEYKQATGALRVLDSNGITGFCCLGVLCDLFKHETGKGRWIVGGSFKVEGDCKVGILPETVARWAGMPESDPQIGHSRKALASKLNDEGKDFNYIAGRIEKYL